MSDRRPLALALVVALAGCTQTPDDTGTATSVAPTSSSDASATPTERTVAFPVEAFADVSEDPVSEEMAAELQAILDDMTAGGGVAATVMSPDGTWRRSGTRTPTAPCSAW
jgi:hypothetical protein